MATAQHPYAQHSAERSYRISARAKRSLAGKLASRQARASVGYISAESGTLKSNNTVFNLAMAIARQTLPAADADTFDARHAAQVGPHDVHMEMKLSDRAMQEIGEKLNEITGDNSNLAIAMTMAAMDKNPRANFGNNPKVNELFDTLNKGEIEVYSEDMPGLAGELKLGLNKKPDAAGQNQQKDEERHVRLTAHEVYDALTEQHFPGMAAAASIGLAIGTGVVFDIFAEKYAENGFEKAAKNLHPNNPKAAAITAGTLTVLYQMVPAFFAETGDATLNYTILQAMDPSSELRSDPSKFWPALKENLGDGAQSGAKAAVMSIAANIVDACGGGFKPSSEGVTFKNFAKVFANIGFSVTAAHYQAVGGALPIILEPYNEFNELKEQFEADQALGDLAIFNHEKMSPQQRAEETLLRDPSNGTALTGLVPTLTMNSLLGLGSAAYTPVTKHLVQMLMTAAKIGLDNPAEALAMGGAVLGGKVGLSVGDQHILSVKDKRELETMVILADQPLGQDANDKIDAKSLARVGLRFARAEGVTHDALANGVSWAADKVSSSPLGVTTAKIAGQVSNAANQYIGQPFNDYIASPIGTWGAGASTVSQHVAGQARRLGDAGKELVEKLATSGLGQSVGANSARISAASKKQAEAIGNFLGTGGAWIADASQQTGRAIQRSIDTVDEALRGNPLRRPTRASLAFEQRFGANAQAKGAQNDADGIKAAPGANTTNIPMVTLDGDVIPQHQFV